MSQVFLFGDSITYGEFDTEQAGWAERLKKIAFEKQLKGSDWIAVYNLGIPGEHTNDFLKRFEREFEARKDPEEENIFVFAFGANDAAFLPDKREFQVPLQRYERNIKNIIEISRSLHGKKIIFLTTIPVLEEVLAKSGRSKERKNEYIEKYNIALKRVCSDEEIDVLDVHSAYLKNGYGDLFSHDGLHPNSAGYKLIFEMVRNRLSEESIL